MAILCPDEAMFLAGEGRSSEQMAIVWDRRRLRAINWRETKVSALRLAETGKGQSEPLLGREKSD
ncbi:hypothetical protein [Baaleninema simplex]|uniref:hypothetical protein n=1 Tax=Baaleninema simplex TaxID=2862350 RepID=UPI001181B114|nr:hypothetical protein [Baaleninema simplex]